MQILRTSGSADIYEALDEYTQPTAVKVDDVFGEKRTLFEQLPEVLFFSLQRLEYTGTGAADKKAESFDFPDVLFMDKYLHQNMDAADEKRYIYYWSLLYTILYI